MIERTTQSRAQDPEVRAAMLRSSWERMQQRLLAGQVVDPAGEEALRKLVQRFCPAALGEAEQR